MIWTRMHLVSPIDDIALFAAFKKDLTELINKLKKVGGKYDL